MKRKITLLIAISLVAIVGAQSPEKLSYQAVIRNSSNQLVTDQVVGIQISILQSSANGVAVYTETHTPGSNSNGLVSLEIGTGTTNDNFSAINWANGPYFVKTEIDPTPGGGTNYSITGTSQLLSVPYALHAKSAETISGTLVEKDPVFETSEAANISATDITNLENLSGTNSGDQDLSNYATKVYIDKLIKIIYDDLLYASKRGIVRDIDSNVYKTIKIGHQVWMAENLKTTKYSDGSNIPLVSDNTAWANLITPGYCWYDNDKNTNSKTYGALYNWYTVNTDKLCPKGWHVPTDTEWIAMKDFLITNGYNIDDNTTSNKIAKSLAAIANWPSNTTIGAPGNTDFPVKRNASGFTALGGGFRSYLGVFSSVGLSGYWWSSTESDDINAWYHALNSGKAITFRYARNKNIAISVRCLRD